MNFDPEELEAEHAYLVWQEWLKKVWSSPTPDEILRRAEETDDDSLPHEFLKVYSQ